MLAGSNMLRDAAINWVRKNCTFDLAVRDFITFLDDVIKKGINCTFVFGPALMRSRAPHLMCWFSGELFILPISRTQSESMGTNRTSIGLLLDERPLKPEPLLPHRISLDHLNVKTVRISPLEKPVVLSCRYEVLEECSDPFCVRLDFTAVARSSYIAWAYPSESLQKRGSLQMSFVLPTPTIAANFGGFNAVMAGFVRVCTMPDRQTFDGRQPISNALPLLLEM